MSSSGAAAVRLFSIRPYCYSRIHCAAVAYQSRYRAQSFAAGWQQLNHLAYSSLLSAQLSTLECHRGR